MKTVTLYTDGGSRGNPGPAAIGYYIPELAIRNGATIGVTTNNDAEYQALIAGLKKVKAVLGKKNARITTVAVRMDSELIVRQMTHRYKITDATMQRRFMTVWNLTLDFAGVNFAHVLRAHNTDADAEVNKALDGADHATQSTLL